MNNSCDSLSGWTPPNDLLHDRVVLITGAANGIGHALARSLAAHGATTVLLDRDVPGLEKTYDEIVAAGHPTPALYPMDLQVLPKFQELLWDQETSLHLSEL
jgi:NAD(P)-dependent dehydrogenase (short-subunit alcohol dehydrogenase family)